MKKLLFIMVLVVGLNANQFICEDANERFQKHHQLMNLANERNDYRRMKIENSLAIIYVEKAIVNCEHTKEQKEIILRLRKAFIGIGEALGGN